MYLTETGRDDETRLKKQQNHPRLTSTVKEQYMKRQNKQELLREYHHHAYLQAPRAASMAAHRVYKGLNNLNVQCVFPHLSRGLVRVS